MIVDAGCDVVEAADDTVGEADVTGSVASGSVVASDPHEANSIPTLTLTPAIFNVRIRSPPPHSQDLGGS
ncbi:MAG TPA: hypothetical protein VMS14_05080, partial [Ilumatobacteraceae bacterium]|nr:hypothetical protein [Ilumatobacteraceae bacterium]